MSLLCSWMTLNMILWVLACLYNLNQSFYTAYAVSNMRFGVATGLSNIKTVLLLRSFTLEKRGWGYWSPLVTPISLWGVGRTLNTPSALRGRPLKGRVVERNRGVRSQISGIWVKSVWTPSILITDRDPFICGAPRACLTPLWQPRCYSMPLEYFQLSLFLENELPSSY